MINSFLSMKMLSSTEFIFFDFFALNNSEFFASYHFKKKHYKILMSKFEINQSYIKKSDIYSYDILLTLQKKTFSFDYERLMIIEANYHRIKKESKNQNVER